MVYQPQLHITDEGKWGGVVYKSTISFSYKMQDGANYWFQYQMFIEGPIIKTKELLIVQTEVCVH